MKEGAVKGGKCVNNAFYHKCIDDTVPFALRKYFFQTLATQFLASLSNIFYSNKGRDDVTKRAVSGGGDGKGTKRCLI